MSCATSRPRAARRQLPRRPLMFEPGDEMGLWRQHRQCRPAWWRSPAGKSIDRYFSDNITGPLGMNDTGFAITEKQRARQAGLHVRGHGRKAGAASRSRSWTAPTAFSGGGGIYSTAPDYLTLLQALLNGGSLRGANILRPETVALMAANQIGNLEAGIMETTNPGAFERRRFLPGRPAALGARPHDQCRCRCRTAARPAA